MMKRLEFINCRRHRIFAIGFLAVLALGISVPCSAHSINVFATAEGEVISGYAYSRGGDRIRQQPIVIQSTEGTLLGKTMTDENGEFTFSATQRIDHVIVLETADGHRATFTISADELPETLIVADETSATNETSVHAETEPAVANPPQEPAIRTETQAISEPGVPGMTKDEIGQLVETAVGRQIRPLREQLETYESTTRLHDTLGGIGYIMGIAGIAFYFLGKRKA